MPDPAELIAYLNSRLVPYSQAIIEMGEAQSQPAAGMYDAECTFGGQVFELRKHLQRLYQGLEVAQIDPGTSLAEMEEATLAVLEANRPALGPDDEFVISQVVSASSTSPPVGQARFNVVVYCQFMDFQTFASGYTKGVRLLTPGTYAVPPQPPSEESVPQETFSLLTDGKGNVTESPQANFLFVSDSRIKLPDRRKVRPWRKHGHGARTGRVP